MVLDNTDKEITRFSFIKDIEFLEELKFRADNDIITCVRSNSMATPVILLFFFILTPFYKDYQGISLVFIIAFCFLTILRGICLFFYAKLYPQQPKLARQLLYSLICLVGVFWGSICLSTVYLYELNWVSLFLLFMISGMTSASVTAFSPNQYLFLTFIGLILAPVAVWGYLHAQFDTVVISLSVTFYLVSIFIICRVLFKRYVDSFAKTYALRIQAKELKKAKDEMEQRVLERTAEIRSINKILVESEQRYNALFSGINDAVFVQCTPQADQPEKFIEINDVACGMLGYSKDELRKMDLFEINTPDSPTDTAQIFEELKDKQDMLFEQTWVTGIGQRIFVEVHARCFEYKGQNAILYAARDITERKKTQDMMIQTEKIMSVGGLAAGMAHEINNPLAGILQTAQVMKNRLGEPIPANIKVARKLEIRFEDIKQYMDKRNIFSMVDSIHNAAQRAAKIVENMLSFARKSSSEFYIEHIPDLMEKTLDIAENDYHLKKRFDFRNIKIHKEYDENLAHVSCKPSEIQQVFFNILTNGSQAMMSMDKLIEPTFRIKISKQDDMAQIEIQDNGPGMSEAIRQRVFEPFFTTKPPGKGTGLGLSVSYMIVKNNHHGTMKIQSEPGKGTSFIIRLPFENAGITV